MRACGILGGGWLGVPLAHYLTQLGHETRISTTKLPRKSLHQNHRFDSFQIKLNQSGWSGEVDDFLKNISALIFLIPPSSFEDMEDYKASLESLAAKMTEYKIRRLLFVSSTSVYGADQGMVHEGSPCEGSEPNSLKLIWAERFLSLNPECKTTVLRFGGLIGPDRHPITYVSGKKNLPRPFAPVNLTPQFDAVDIIKDVLEKDLWGYVLNAVHPLHPCRMEYYSSVSEKRGMPKPEFDLKDYRQGKKVEGRLLNDLLGPRSWKNLME